MTRIPGFIAIALVGLLLLAPAVRAQRIDKTVYGTQVADDILLAAARRLLSELPQDGYQVDPAGALRQLKTSDVILLDVRSTSQWRLDRVVGAIHVPLPELAARLDQLPANKNAEIIVFCQDGTRGTMAMTILRMLGYTNVRNLRGGLNAWGGNGIVVNDREVK
jgi:rhodanese-related sulfurtransferase